MFTRIIKSQHGFGFFGMMVLVIVLAILGSIVMVTIDTTVSNQALNETVKKMDRLATAIAKHKADSTTGARPATLADLLTSATPCTKKLVPATSTQMEGWCGPYIAVEVSNDPLDYQTDGWGTTFSWTQATGTLRSFGPNKVDNAGAIDDIERTGL